MGNMFKQVCLASFTIALLGELHQLTYGYSFNIIQLFDGKLHHEHFILLAVTIGLYSSKAYYSLR